MFTITHDTTLAELVAYLESNGNPTSRVPNPRWFHTRIGQNLGIVVLLSIFSPLLWFFAWLFFLNWLLVGLLVGPSIFAACEFLLPPRLRLGWTKLQFTAWFTLYALVFCYSHFVVKILLVICWTLGSIVGPSIFYPVHFKKMGEDNTLLHVALFERARPSVIRRLIEAGADCNAQNSACDTPLHFAVTHSLEMVEILLSQGAVVDAENFSKKIPLDLCTKPGIASALLSAGSRGNAKFSREFHEMGSTTRLLNIPQQLAKKLNKGQTLCFLSHHKEDSAGLAVYIHGVLCTRFRCDSTKIFLDSNELGDLRQLLDLVRNTKVLVVMQTRGVLTRPFCLAELYFAITHNLPVVALFVEGGGYDFDGAKRFLSLGEAFRQELEERNPGAAKTLESIGLNVNEMAQVILAVLPNIISKPFNASSSERVRTSQIDDICAAICEGL